MDFVHFQNKTFSPQTNSVVFKTTEIKKNKLILLLLLHVFENTLYI